ncbi:MAG TPA: YbdD/YjiX family protein [Pilimelia sp.]|nr:YbdD/YjiX family protein [Pilimelia sp.]
MRAGYRAAAGALARVWAYARELSGETAYDHYLDHRRRHCPAGPVLTRREFERVKHQPNVRCC